MIQTYILKFQLKIFHVLNIVIKYFMSCWQRLEKEKVH